MIIYLHNFKNKTKKGEIKLYNVKYTTKFINYHDYGTFIKKEVML